MKILSTSAEVSENLTREKQAVKRMILEHYYWLEQRRIILTFVVAIDLNIIWLLYLNSQTQQD